MSNKYTLEEHLEGLWYMKEESDTSIESLKTKLEGKYDSETIKELSMQSLVTIDEDSSNIALTEKGMDYACKIVRSHRLAERMLYDVFGRNIEQSACEFEHIITPEIVNSICTLLGHPRQCPHGLAIPPGQCCKDAAKYVENSVKHLSNMKVGETAKIAYISSSKDSELHRLNGLRIRPGVIVKVHQTYPTYVIECEGASIAVDEKIAYSICVWSKTSSVKNEKTTENSPNNAKKRSLLSSLFGSRRRENEV
ncbi:magnetosome protein Mad30 [Candidatus Magnetoovum chiemensis]|nr:magnetosome protein Mad30 [Candidatus Magnetoovum chiemensis]